MNKKRYKSENEKLTFFIFCIFLFCLFMLLISPVLLRIRWVKECLKIFLIPLGDSISVYISMVGSLFGVSTTLFFTIWQNEKSKSSEMANRQEKDIQLFVELIQNMEYRMVDLIEIIKKFRIKKSQANKDNVIHGIVALETKYRQLNYNGVYTRFDVKNKDELKKAYEDVITELDDYFRKAQDVRYVWNDLNRNLEDKLIIEIEKKINLFENTVYNKLNQM